MKECKCKTTTNKKKEVLGKEGNEVVNNHEGVMTIYREEKMRTKKRRLVGR